MLNVASTTSCKAWNNPVDYTDYTDYPRESSIYQMVCLQNSFGIYKPV